MKFAFVLALTLIAETVEIKPVVEQYGQFEPPHSAMPFVGIWHNRGPEGVRHWTAQDNIVSKIGGLSIAKDKMVINLNGKTVWTDGVGIYGYDGIDGELATKLIASGKTPESREISRRGYLESFAIPESVVVRNGTIVAKQLTNLSKDVLTLENVRYVTVNPAVADDQKLPLTFRALSAVGNEGTLTSLEWSISDPEKAVFQPRQTNDPEEIRGYLVPIGATGMVTVTLTGLNRKGEQVTGSLEVEIVGGAVQVIQIEALPPVDK